MHVGTPPQHFHVLPSFHGQTLFVPIDQDCARMNVTDCGTLRGVEVFASQKSIGFQVNASSTWEEIGIYEAGLGKAHNFTGNAVFGYDTVGPSSSDTIDVPTLERLPVAAYATPDLWLGQLGLSMFALNLSDTDEPHSFLSRLKEEGHIPSLSFGYQAGAPYRYTKVPGSLVLGGYDRSRRGDRYLHVPATEDIIVGLQRLNASVNGQTIPLVEKGILTVIDTNVPELWLPPAACDAFAAAFNLTWHPESDRYAITDANHTLLANADPLFNFEIGTSTSGGETILIEIPYSAFDVQAAYPIFASSTNYFPLRRALNDSQFALGRTFLQEIYITVDWERDSFNISQAVFNSPMPDSNIVTIEPRSGTLIEMPGPTSEPGKKLSPGAIAGIAIGGLLVILLLVGGWWMWRRKNAAKTTAEETSIPIDEKKDPNDFAPESVEKPIVRTNLELEGQPVGELWAPPGEAQKGASNEVAELAIPEPVYELPSPDLKK